MKANRLNDSLLNALARIGRSYQLPVETRVYWRVDIVCDSNKSRAPGTEAMSKEKAEELASWFGKTNDLHAEVVGPLQQMSITVDAAEGGVI